MALLTNVPVAKWTLETEKNGSGDLLHQPCRLSIRKLFALLWFHFAAQIRQGCPQIFVRIDRRVMNADLIMQVRACSAAAVPYIADHLTANYHLTSDHGKARHMAVDGLDPMAVIEDNLAAVAVGH